MSLRTKRPRTDPPNVTMDSRLTLPWPPSVNHYWRSWQGRVLVSKAGREYRELVTLLAGVRRPLLGRIAVAIQANPPDHRRRDLDNITKALLDALQHAGLYEDDAQIDILHIERGAVVANGSVVVVVSEIKPEA